jgi:purine-nucleoside phosphorylase
MDLFSKAQAAADVVSARAGLEPRVGIILGSGLGGFAAQVADAVAIPYAESWCWGRLGALPSR